MRLMLVDDEERVLQGVMRSLSAMGVTWDIVAALSGEKALEALERAPVDAVIADLHMPEMDGSALLREVRARWPDTFRILLCGDDRFVSSSLVGVHQFLTKPCDGLAIINTIERLYGLQSLLESPALRMIVRGADVLPSPPRVYGKLVRCIADPQAGYDPVDTILNRHPSLLRDVVCLANVPAVRREGPIVNMRGAAAAIGLDRLLLLALALETFAADRIPTVGLPRLQQAMFAALMGERIGAGRPFQTDGSTAALLYDVGLLLPAVDAHCRRAELRGEGAFTHIDAGAYLLHAWGLPYPVVEAVAYHREPWRVHPREFNAAGVAYVASCLARETEPSDTYLRRCGVFADLAEWTQCASELKMQLADLHRHFDAKGTPSASRTRKIAHG
ncbi:MAG TPA: HDOD domain-containing protein [Rudaea sp.]|nr:HDOD domain-containing protein [Rudaea sp.]